MKREDAGNRIGTCGRCCAGLRWGPSRAAPSCRSAFCEASTEGRRTRSRRPRRPSPWLHAELAGEPPRGAVLTDASAADGAARSKARAVRRGRAARREVDAAVGVPRRTRVEARALHQTVLPSAARRRSARDGADVGGRSVARRGVGRTVCGRIRGRIRGCIHGRVHGDIHGRIYGGIHGRIHGGIHGRVGGGHVGKRVNGAVDRGRGACVARGENGDKREPRERLLGKANVMTRTSTQRVYRVDRAANTVRSWDAGGARRSVVCRPEPSKLRSVAGRSLVLDERDAERPTPRRYALGTTATSSAPARPRASTPSERRRLCPSPPLQHPPRHPRRAPVAERLKAARLARPGLRRPR